MNSSQFHNVVNAGNRAHFYSTTLVGSFESHSIMVGRGAYVEVCGRKSRVQAAKRFGR